MEDIAKSRFTLYQQLDELIKSGSHEVEEYKKLTTELRSLGNSDDTKYCDQIMEAAIFKSNTSDSILTKLEQNKNKDSFKYIYALHSLNKNSQASNQIAHLAHTSQSADEYYYKLLEAQILYKIDDKDKAFEIFSDLLRDEGNGHAKFEDDRNEIITNLLASVANSQSLTESNIQQAEKEYKGTVNSDYAFNSALAYASLGKTEIAAKKLKECYEIAKDEGEANSHKFNVLSSYIVAQLLSNRADNSDLSTLESKLTGTEPNHFDADVNEVCYLNNII